MTALTLQTPTYPYAEIEHDGAGQRWLLHIHYGDTDTDDAPAVTTSPLPKSWPEVWARQLAAALTTKLRNPAP